MYLKNTATPRTPTVVLYKAFEGSKTLTDFLRRAKLEETYIQNFLKEHSPVAERDYARIKERYFNQKELFDVDDEQLSD